MGQLKRIYRVGLVSNMVKEKQIKQFYNAHLKWVKTFSIAVVSMMALGVTANAQQLADNYPDRYTVVKGDTP